MSYKLILQFQIFSTIFTIFLGTVLHFTFKWSNENLYVGAFSAINESTWEHLKLVFFPMLITTIIGYFYLADDIPNFLCTKTIGIVIALLFTITFFYTYTGILGKNFAILNILTFILSAILGEYATYKIAISNYIFNELFCIILLSILFFSFIVFTFFTPKLGLFKDPITNSFGLQKN